MIPKLRGIDHIHVFVSDRKRAEPATRRALNREEARLDGQGRLLHCCDLFA
jgi:hypothetical protein